MWAHACYCCFSVHGSNRWRKEKKMKRERAKSSDLTCAASAVTFVGVWVRDKLRSIGNNTSVIYRWSSQRQAAWCQLIWWDAGRAADTHTADLEAVWNSTIRRKQKSLERRTTVQVRFPQVWASAWQHVPLRAGEFLHVQKPSFIHQKAACAYRKDSIL